MAAESLSCVSCGAKNPSNLERCNDCGATLDKMIPITTGRVGVDGEIPNFGVSWFGAALGIDAVLLGLLIVALPFVIKTYDPQGFAGIAIAIGVFFFGGLVVGRLAPYRAYLECVAASTLAAVLIVPYIASISDVRALDGGRYVLGAIVGILAGGLGAFLGERKSDGGASPSSPSSAGAR